MLTETEFKTLLAQQLSLAADVLLLHDDPCQVTSGRCRRGETCCSRETYLAPADQPCPLLGTRGCKVSNLACKLWFCETAWRVLTPESREAYLALERVAKTFGLFGAPYLGEDYAGKLVEISQLK